ncbi:MAG: beta-ketoacyl synthase chain length factor [Burkholderiales bacterium]|nr:beta-ketoacyl synthase chain length factor [Burkholderiales bacterium]
MERTLYIDGLGLWTPALPGWATARAALRGETPAAADPAPGPGTPVRRPAPALLGANERRRAPDTVLLALEVASQALAGSGHDAAGLASVFASAHGDLPTTDALCRTLAADPQALSPTRFHHSVHNAASGYWAIASGSHAASTALAAGEHSFGAGLLEAATQCAADGAPVLLVALDTEACGALASANRSRGQLALALLLAPRRSGASHWALRWWLQPAADRHEEPPASAAARALAANAMAPALPLFEALAGGRPARRTLPLSASTRLELQLEPLAAALAPAAAA